jgi:hypothetical protein
MGANVPSDVWFGKSKQDRARFDRGTARNDGLIQHLFASRSLSLAAGRLALLELAAEEGGVCVNLDYQLLGGDAVRSNYTSESVHLCRDPQCEELSCTALEESESGREPAAATPCGS